MKPGKITDEYVMVIGSCGLDIVGQHDLPLEGGSSNAARVRPSFGGTGRNVAENLVRLGQNVKLISAVGDDPFGQLLLDSISKSGVDTTACLTTSEYSTACYLAVLDSEKGLDFALDDMRIHTLITPVYLRKYAKLIEAACLVFIDSNLTPAAVRAVIKFAGTTSARICANTTARHLANRLTPHLDHLFLITGNTGEFSELTGINIPIGDRQATADAARAVINAGAEIAVVTMGEYGVCYATSDTSGHVPAIQTRIFDPTGAGDAMTAAIIFGILNNIPLDQSIALGVFAASLTLRTPGSVLNDLSIEKLYGELNI
jgi:pseudouridine kinase